MTIKVSDEHRWFKLNRKNKRKVAAIEQATAEWEVYKEANKVVIKDEDKETLATFFESPHD